MKRLPVLTLIFVACAGLASAQPASTSDKHTFGDRQIHVPAPDGYTNIFGRFARVTARLSATEAPAADLLALHVPESFIPNLKASEEIDLGSYTKVSTIKRLRTIEVTAEMYKMVVMDLEKNFGTYLDPNGPAMKNVEKNSEKGLAGIGNKTTVDLTSTKNLGFFEKTPQIFSALTVFVIEIYGRKVTTLASVSVLHINQRLVMVSAYKMFPGENDVKALTDFTKNWTAKIIAANK